MVVMEDLKSECLVIWDAQAHRFSALVKVQEVVQEGVSGSSCLDLWVHWPLGVAEGLIDGAKVVVQGIALPYLVLGDLENRRGCIGFWDPG